MWAVITVICLFFHASNSFNLPRFSASKTCFDYELHPFFHLTWNERRFHLFKVASFSKRETTFFLKANQLAQVRLAVTANFKENRSVKFNLHKNGAVMSISPDINFFDFESFEYTYENLHDKHSHEFHVKKTDDQNIGAREFNFMFTHSNGLKKKGKLTFSCDEARTDRNCTIAVATTFPHYRIIGEIGLSVRQTSDSGVIMVQPFPNRGLNLFLSLNWTLNGHDLSGDFALKRDFQHLIMAKATHAIEKSKTLATAHFLSEVFDFKSFLRYERYLEEDEKTMTSFSLETNYLHQPSAFPMKYRFGLQEGNSGKFLDLRHNLTSKLYKFEGNMTIDEENAQLESCAITRIWQKIRTPISDSFKFDLEQVINQTGSWSWETTVMHSGLMDMHVSAQWGESILDYYAKKFQFKSYYENILPSFNLLVSYLDRVSFLHRFEIPFEAVAYEVMVKRLSKKSLIPIEVHFLSQDGFKTNFSLPMASLYIFGDLSLLEVRFLSEPQLEQATAALLSTYEKFSRFFSNENGTLNKILHPLLGQPTVSDWSRNVVAKCTYILNESLSYFISTQNSLSGSPSFLVICIQKRRYRLCGFLRTLPATTTCAD